MLEAGWPRGQVPYGAVTSSRKGGGRLHLHVTGREAHAGTEYERGASAILALARQVDALHGLTGRWPGVTVNAGVIRGGTVSNVVAGSAYAEVDLRVGRVEDIEPLEAACRAIAAETHVPGTFTRLEGGIIAPPMERSRGVALLVELAQAEAAALGFSLAEHASGGTSDASYIAAGGTPVLDGLGPVGAQDHSPDEYLLIDSLAPRIALLSRLIIAISSRATELAAVKPT